MANDSGTAGRYSTVVMKRVWGSIIACLVSVTAGACDADGEAEPRSSLDDFEAPYHAIWRQNVGGLCASIIVLDADEDAWAGQVCEGPMQIRRIGHATPSEVARVVNAFAVLPVTDTIAPAGCEAYLELHQGTWVGFHVEAHGSHTLKVACSPPDGPLAEPFAAANAALESLR